MPGIQPLPGARNPWVDSLPRFIQNLALQKVAQNFRAKEAEMQRAFDEAQDKKRQTALKEKADTDRASRVSEGGKNREGRAAVAKSNREHVKSRLVRGPKNYWERKDGIDTKTGIPVPPPGQGTQLTVEDGKTTFSQGNVGPLTKTNQSKVQADLIDINDRMGRLSGIIGKYKSSYQNVFTRVGMSWDALKDMTGLGKQLTPEKRTALGEYSNYKKEAVREFGLEIQRLAKGNLTKNEEKLYGRGLPNPGTGWFDGDSPAEFEAALRTSYKNLDKIRARKHYYLNKLNYTQPQIDSMLDNNSILGVDAFMGKVDEIAQKREAEIVKQLQASGKPVDPQMVKSLMKKFLNEEFGFKF